MTKFPKIIRAVFLSIFILQMIGLVVLFLIPDISQAASDPITFTPQVTIDSTFQKGVGITIDKNSIGNYIQSIYKYAIGIVGILATVVMMFGGFLWLTAGGNSSQIGEAQEWIKASLTGLVIALASYTILSMVNPALVTMTPIKPITQPQGCCYSVSNGKTAYCRDNAEKNNCTGNYVDGTCEKISACSTYGFCHYLSSNDMTCKYMLQTECTKKAGESFPNKSDCDAKLTNKKGGCCAYNLKDDKYLNCISEEGITQEYCKTKSGLPNFISGKKCEEYISGIVTKTTHYKCE